MRLEILDKDVKYFGYLDEDNSFVFIQYPDNIKCRVPGNIVLNTKFSGNWEIILNIIAKHFGVLDDSILSKIEDFILSANLDYRIQHVTQSGSDSLNLKVEGDCIELLAFYDHENIMVPFRLDAVSLDFLITKLQDAQNKLKIDNHMNYSLTA